VNHSRGWHLLGARQQGSAPTPSSRGEGDDFQLRVNAPVHVAAGDTASTVWVVNHGATVEGVVREGLLVVNGMAKVTGTVEGGIVIVNGQLDLAPSARVERDILLYRSTLTRAPGAVVAGAVHNRPGFSIGPSVMWLAWLSATVVVVVAGLLFAELAPATLTGTASHLTTHRSRAIATGLLMVACVPAAAFLSFATVIGIPLGLTLVFALIPALSFLGYLVTGAAIGVAAGARSAGTRPYRETLVGLLTLQILAAVPLIGGLVVLVACVVGAGAIVARAWTQRQRPVLAGVPAPVAS
jgi:hypothetical protein